MSRPREILTNGLAQVSVCLLLIASGALLPGTPATAQEALAWSDQMTDAQFHRAIACGAAPGKDCIRTALRWSPAKRANISIGVAVRDATLTRREAQSAQSALEAAIKQINEAGAGVRLTLVTSGAPDIRVEFADYAARRLDQGTTDLTARVEALQNGALTDMTLANRETIRSARVTLFDRATGTDQKSITLNILLKTLGLNGAIEGRYYQNRSVFAVESNRVTRLKGQDLTILRMHYPPAG